MPLDEAGFKRATIPFDVKRNGLADRTRSIFNGQALNPNLVRLNFEGVSVKGAISASLYPIKVVIPNKDGFV
jgi:NADPH-dependent ferric siderophore reductase